MKPGNLRFCKVPNPAAFDREMRFLKKLYPRLLKVAVFFCVKERKEYI